MAVGWKSLAGIVGAASVVSVGTLYSVLVREPARSPSPTGGDSKPAVTTNPPADTAQKPAPTGDQAADKPGSSASQASKTAGGNPGAAKTEPAKSAEAGAQMAKPDPGKPDSGKANVAQSEVAKTEAAKPQPPKPEAPAPDAAKGQIAPTFDIARIEPAGGAVIAGRAASGATVELLRNGNPYARVVADINGTWAITPPALPKGPCELTLRTTSPDGKITLSEQTLSVRVPEKPGEEVVVVLNTPDQPSKVLTDAAQPPSKAPETPATPSPAGETASAEADKASSRANVSIRTVEADEMGRFFVTGRAEPGAALRIYLNDTLVTGVTAAKDGTFGMTIEKGMQPGNYRVRVDDVAAGNGQVLTRAEVPFAMIDKAPAASAPAVVAAIATPSRPAGSPGGQPAATPPQGATTPSAAASGAATPTPDKPASGEPTPGGKPQPAAASAPAQGTSPATAPGSPATATTETASTPAQAEIAPPASGNATAPRSATTPAASNPGTPATAPVQTSEAKPAQPSPPPSVAVIPEIRTTTIVQGDNLWRISRKVYGQGIRYTWIYDANTDQIRNPNLIYPGQIFVMPEKKAP
ncbi:LysM peptidoglycan-binding domain-containing protein [Labrys okinawensis]|uniref:LysM peptidoglycan-binding domain-containing protein n=1 Tax=Labrys okinawensis TaxID=346911 RepID=UPI001FDFF711|nr:LysM peptidoglycan-binding domain-containing protein [Labrys okinawensis]